MAERARRSPSARLYSSVPRSSQWPSISTRKSPFLASHAALASRIFVSAGRRVAESNAKWIGLSASSARYSLGGAGRGAGGGGAGATTGGGGGGVTGAGAGAGAGGGGAAGAGAG